jgi:hypothetical protein
MTMDVRQIVDLVKQTPGIQQAVDIIEAQLERAPIMPEDLDEIISMLEAVVEDPNRYPEVRAAAIQDGVVREEEAPPEYDPTFVLAVLVALYGYRDRLSQQGYARGGLKVAGRQLAAAGRGGDSMLAHINPREAEMLRRMGGSGTVNPNTGLREYKSGKGLLGAILPIALNFIAPGLGAAIGGALGATGTAATVLGSAVIGGASAALTGGDPLKGAVMGGLGGGLGSVVGGATSNALGLGLGQTGQSLLGGALVGGAAGALSGEGFGKGALMGTAGAGLGIVSQGAGTGAFGQGLGAAGQTAGNMLTAGYKPKEAILGGGLSGLVSGLSYKQPQIGLQLKPSDAVVEGLKKPPMADAVTGNIRLNKSTGKMEYSPTLDVDYSFASKNQPAPLLSDGVVSSFTGLRLSDGPSSGLQLPADTSAFGPRTAAASFSLPSSLGLKDVGTLALVSQLAGQRPPEVNEAIQKMAPEQQEYFNRPSIKWDWNKLQSDANAQRMSLSQYMSTYWPQIAAGTYSMEPAAMAMGGRYAMGGGPLGAVARLVRGGGSGRDDTVNARLSDGEYVMDAETVAMLGDGSTDAGAKRLDAMRAQLRKHKGKTLARGKFSPNAKSPLAYMKGAA